MKTVMRGNKQMQVQDERLDDMLQAGYVEVDGKTGKVIPRDEDTGEDKKETAALKKENAALKKENTALKKENEALSEQLKTGLAKAQPPE